MNSYETPPSPITLVLPEPAPIDSFYGPEFGRFGSMQRQAVKRRTKSYSGEKVTCTCCGSQVPFLVSKNDIFAHPTLSVVTCRRCHKFYHTGGFTQDEEGSDEQCKWCGEGGNLLCCSFCPATFCDYCIKRNFSRKDFNKFRDMDEWRCLVCDGSPLSSKVRECKSLLEIQRQRFYPQSSRVRDNNHDSEVFHSLTENNRHIDDLMAALETLKTTKNDATQQDVTPDGKKVNPITILKKKENYIIRSRSRSPNSLPGTQKRDFARPHSDPESKRSPHALKKTLNAVTKTPSVNSGEDFSVTNETNHVTTTTQRERAVYRAVSVKDEVFEAHAENDTDNESSASTSKEFSETDFSELTVTSGESTDDNESSWHEDVLGEDSDLQENQGRSVSPMSNEEKVSEHHEILIQDDIQDTIDKSSPLADGQHSMAVQEETVEVQGAVGDDVADNVVFDDIASTKVSSPVAEQNSHQAQTYRQVFQRAEKCIFDLMEIVEELGQISSPQNGPDAKTGGGSKKSPTQFSRFRMTGKLLKGVKRMQSKISELEGNLRSQKDGLGKYRPSYGMDRSSDEESPRRPSRQNEVAKERSKIPSSTQGSGNRLKLSGDAPNGHQNKTPKERSNTPSPTLEDTRNQRPMSDGAQSSSPAENTPSAVGKASLGMRKVHAFVVLKRLTDSEIRRFGSGNSGFTAAADNDDDDSDSSKAAFRPGSCDENNHENDSSASSNFEDFESRIEKQLQGLSSENEQLGRVKKSSKAKEAEKKNTKNKQESKMRVIASDDDTDLSDREHSSEDLSTADLVSPIKISNGPKIKDNEMAMNLLLQKMDDFTQEPDSDVEELLAEDKDKKIDKTKKTPENGDKAEKRDNGASDDPASGEESEKTEAKVKHPLLNEKWKLEEKANDSKEDAKTRENKRKLSDAEVKQKPNKKIRRKLDLDGAPEPQPSDSDLTTDSGEDLELSQHRKKKKDDKRKRRVVLSDSDSDTIVPMEKENHSEEAIEIQSSGNESKGSGASDFESDLEESPVRKRKRRRLVQWGSDGGKIKKKSVSDAEEDSPRRGRRNIRKIIADDHVSQSTKLASQEESLRRKRLEKERTWEEQNEEVIVIDDESQTPVKKIVTSRLILSKKPLIEVHKELLKVLKPHQLEGIRFMWDNLIEKVVTANSKAGNGCILAHCMGLGKTLQVVAFLYTVLMDKHLHKLKSALILCPFGTVNNWVHEFRKWLTACGAVMPVDFKFRRLPVSELHSAVSNQERAQKLRHWSYHGGVMVIGYGLYRTLMSDKKRLSCTLRTAFDECLSSPGPDIVICDEGHILKNASSNIANVVQLLKTRRRVVLTGTPLQNNMVEYHCMVSFVKPRLLGTLNEYKNRFINPIENGQHVDSTERDVKLMKKRAHVLHELLSGCVQRKDYSCLRSHLPQKYEYVLSVRLSDLQIRMYQHYLTRHSGDHLKLKKACLFKDFNTLLLLVCHPRCLVLQKERAESKAVQQNDNDEDDMRNFVVDEAESESDGKSSSDSTIVISDEDSDRSEELKPNTEEDLHGMSSRRLRKFIASKQGEKVTTKNRKKLVNLATKYLDVNFHKTPEFVQFLKKKSVQELKALIRENNGSSMGCAEKSDLVNKVKSLVSTDTEETEWFEKLMPTQENLARSNTNSGKITLMLEILHGATTAGDKVVIFSQSLLTLDLIEDVLKAETQDFCKGLLPKIEPYSKWYRNVDYYRLDGSTPGNLRDRWIREFNNARNARGRLFLISTRAGGIGINLVGANRAIVFDASWNPSHDIQSIFRIYRFGQTKPCFVYRFIAQGTMEEKIYERQVVKQSLAFRVVDEQQILRHFSAADIRELYNFKPAPKPVLKRDENGKEIQDETPHCAPPRDSILASIIKTVATRDIIVTYHEHDSLLDHQVSEELTEAERKAAWEEYDDERSKNDPLRQNNFMAALPTHVLMELQKKASDILSAIAQKMSDTKIKSLSEIATEIRLQSRSMDTDTLSKLALSRHLDLQILHRRLIQLKKYVMKKKESAQRYLEQKRMQPAAVGAPPTRPRMPVGTAPIRPPPVTVHPRINLASTSGFRPQTWRPTARPTMNPRPMQYARTSAPPPRAPRPSRSSSDFEAYKSHTRNIGNMRPMYTHPYQPLNPMRPHRFTARSEAGMTNSRFPNR